MIKLIHLANSPASNVRQHSLNSALFCLWTASWPVPIRMLAVCLWDDQTNRQKRVLLQIRCRWPWKPFKIQVLGGSKRTGPLLGDRRRKCQRPPSAETRNSAPSQLIVGGARPLRRQWPHPGCKVVCRRIDCRNSALLGAPDSAANGTVLPTISGESVRTDPFPLVQTPRDIQSAILGRRQMEGSTQPKLLGAPVSMCPANSALISPSDDTVRVLDGVTQEQMAT